MASLGRRLAEVEEALGVEQPSLLSVCYRNRVPIFVGAVQDGSIFLNAVKMRLLLGDEFKFEIDINEDVLAMGRSNTTAVIDWARSSLSGSWVAAFRRITPSRRNPCSHRFSKSTATVST